MGYSPAAITALYPLLEKQFPSAKRSGVYNDKPGYHNSRRELIEDGRTGDYSIQLDIDREGDSDAASAIDCTMNTRELGIVSRRLMAASKAGDPRLKGKIREWFGSFDGNGVNGYSLLRDRIATSDDSHEWHFHISGHRRYCNDKKVWLGIAEVLLGLPAGQLSNPAPEVVPVVPKTKIGLAAAQAGMRAGGKGDPSPEALLIQDALNRWRPSFRLAEDGYFGRASRTAAAQFQFHISLSPKPTPWPQTGWDAGDGDIDGRGDADGILGRQSLTALGFDVQP